MWCVWHFSLCRGTKKIIFCLIFLFLAAHGRRCGCMPREAEAVAFRCDGASFGPLRVAGGVGTAGLSANGFCRHATRCLLVGCCLLAGCLAVLPACLQANKQINK